MKLRRLLYITSALLLLALVFTIDVIRKSVALDVGGLNLLRDLMIIGAFGLIYYFAELSNPFRDESPIKKLALVLIYATALTALTGIFFLAIGEGFDAKSSDLLPLDYPTVFLATAISIAAGVFAVLVFRILRELVLYKPRRGSRRNLLIFVVLSLACAVSTLPLKPLEGGLITTLLFAFAVMFAVINSFRLPWIVYLTKREKMFGLLYGFLLFIGFILLSVVFGTGSIVHRSLLYYSYPLEEFIRIISIWGTVFFGMTFVSTLFHLPTAEAFERKTTEVSSLHNLSRLITQAFNFNELADSVTSMTLQVCEASSCWLEMIHPLDAEDARGSGYSVQVVGTKNIAQHQIDALLPTGERTFRDMAIEQRKPLVVDDLRGDDRLPHLRTQKAISGSLVAAPLVSHAGLVGILYASKETEHGFFKDDIDVISAFADQATIAIENSRLFKKSLERERLIREMTVAQEIQRKLLPQSLPRFPALELDAVSTPAFEVGGDYYDIARLDDDRLGIVVGDVSGKGVSAAFYMSEMKGIFQSLSRLYPSPREFMVRANEALRASIDKHSFVTLIYAIVDVRRGTLTLSRAGHCPMLHRSGTTARYVRPSGIGLGLIDGRTFVESIAEESLRLIPGDVCVFYTDGVTEARRGDEEFGYERLAAIVAESGGKPASAVKHEILETVQSHLDHQANDDDLTLVVLRWRGHDSAH